MTYEWRQPVKHSELLLTFLVWYKILQFLWVDKGASRYEVGANFCIGDF